MTKNLYEAMWEVTFQGYITSRKMATAPIMLVLELFIYLLIN